jgi:peroxiredoxin
MNQRPSRNYLRQLSKKAQELKAKDIVVIAVQASKINENTLNEWIKKNDIPFPIGMIQGDEEKICFAWGVRSLPWLILTDTKHIVRAEGFAFSELDEKLKTINKE